jgi:hypothetical protein
MKVKFIHIRRTRPTLVPCGPSPLYFYKIDRVQSKGGTTIAYILDDDYKVIGFASAKCSKKDYYVKRLGRQLAESRLKDEKFYKDVPALDEQVFIDVCVETYKQ